MQEVVMSLLDQWLVGVVILLVLALLVVIERRAIGSMIDLPSGDVLLKTVNIFNLLFLLIVSPLAAVLLITGTASSIAFFCAFLLYLVLQGAGAALDLPRLGGWTRFLAATAPYRSARFRLQCELCEANR
jgi:hypothetical protein